VFELVDATRGEAPAAWLGRADARRGLLAAQLVDDSLPVDAAPLAALLGTGGDPLDRDVLALAWRRGLSIAAERLEPLLGSGDPRVRVLALRLLGAAAPERARPLAQRAAADSDPFVRAAAADVRQRRRRARWRLPAAITARRARRRRRGARP